MLYRDQGHAFEVVNQAAAASASTLAAASPSPLGLCFRFRLRGPASSPSAAGWSVESAAAGRGGFGSVDLGFVALPGGTSFLAFFMLSGLGCLGPFCFFFFCG